MATPKHYQNLNDFDKFQMFETPNDENYEFEQTTYYADENFEYEEKDNEKISLKSRLKVIIGNTSLEGMFIKFIILFAIIFYINLGLFQYLRMPSFSLVRESLEYSWNPFKLIPEMLSTGSC